MVSLVTVHRWLGDADRRNSEEAPLLRCQQSHVLDYFMGNIDEQGQHKYATALLYFCQFLPLKWEVEFCIPPYLILQRTGSWQCQLMTVQLY